MSRMKSHAENLAIRRMFSDMTALERIYERERLERLAWEAQRAMTDYLAALTEFEKHRDDDAGRRADAEIKAGHTPF